MKRFADEDIIFDDDFDFDPDSKEISGYLWATDALVMLTPFEADRKSAKCVDDCEINFYPVYNMKTKEFSVDVNETIDNEQKSDFTKIMLTDEEAGYIKNKFIEYYFETEEKMKNIINELM